MERGNSGSSSERGEEQQREDQMEQELNKKLSALQPSSTNVSSIK